jgi:phage terminase small subunit
MSLKNPRHELFCQLTPQGAKNGWTQGELYQRAGFKARGHSAETLGCNLLKKVEIQQRIAELQAPAVRKAGVSVASLLAELEQARAAAHNDRQFSASVQAIAGKARLTGFDRAENGGSGSEFSRCESVADVMQVLMAGETASSVLESLDTLRSEVEAYSAEHADVIATKPAWPRAPSESALALALLKPGRR